MNVYDFDKTIYHGDSTSDFYFYCLSKNLLLVRYLPYQGWSFLRWKLGAFDKTAFKQRFYIFLHGVKDVDKSVRDFWDKKLVNIKKFYLETKAPDDVIISASPEFLLKEACRRLEIAHLMASRVDKRTGKYTGVNCWGEEKVLRYREIFAQTEIDEFYSDSRSDTPLAKLAKSAFLVKGNKILPW